MLVVVGFFVVFCLFIFIFILFIYLFNFLIFFFGGVGGGVFNQ